MLVIILGSLILLAAVGGKAFLQATMAMPVIGGLAAWYFNLAGPLPDGIVSNLLYGGMAAQIILMPLGILLYAPGWIRRLWPVLTGRKPVPESIKSEPGN